MNPVVESLAIPRVRSFVPVLGHGLSFIKDADVLMQRCFEKYGHEFQLNLAGKRVTMLLNPHDIATMFAESKRLDGEAVNLEMSHKVFGHDYRYFETNERWNFRKLSNDFARQLRGKGLDATSEAMHNHLESNVYRQFGHDKHQGQLFDFIARQVFEAGSAAMFGDGFCDDPDQLYQDFSMYDKHFQNLAGGCPKALIPGMRKAEKRINSRFGSPRPNQAPFMDSRLEILKGADRQKVAQLDTANYWASQSNTVAIASYCVFHILRDPEAREAILSEVREVMAQSSATTAQGNPLITQDVLAKMVKLDAAIDETLRLNGTGLSMRQISEHLQPMPETVDLSLHSGRTLHLKLGEYVAIYPRFMHMHPDIFANPEVFKWDRFLGRQGVNQFSYLGNPIKNALVAFGGGVGMCPGRHFARNEFKIITAVILNLFDIELHETAIPEKNNSRVGLGSFVPLTDIPFSFSVRQQ